MSENYKGVSKVKSLANKFVKNLTELAEQSNTMAVFMLEGGAARSWNQALIFKEKKDPYDPGNSQEAFSRTEELDKQYKSIFDDSAPGTDGDIKAVKMQAAYLQALERSLNLRYCGLTRSEAFASGRRKGQQSKLGPLLGPSGVLGYVQKIIEKSQTGS